MDVLSTQHTDLESKASATDTTSLMASAEEEWPAFEDPLLSRFHGLELSGVEAGPWGAEFWVDVFVGAVPVVWLGWVVHSGDLQLWTKTLVCGALLIALNGFIAWATVVPDPSGWGDCKERLGPGGLMNYRVFAAGQDKAGESSDPTQIISDLFMLEVRGLWLMGRQSRQYVCVGALFSATTSYCVLFSLSLYDAVRSFSWQLEETRRVTVLTVTGFALALALSADVTFSIVSGHHYTMDLVLAVALTPLVYSSPVVATAAENWARAAFEAEASKARPLEVDAARGPQQQQMPMPIGRTEAYRVSTDTMASMDIAGNMVGPLKDVAEVTIAPCCIPFCSLGGTYHLREGPGSATGRPWTPEAARLHLQQQSDLVHQRDQLLDQLRQRRGELEREREHARERELQRAEAERRQRELLLQQLSDEEERTFAEANCSIQEECSRRAVLEERDEGLLERLVQLEAEAAEANALLTASAEEARRIAAQALESLARHEAEAKEAEDQLQQLGQACGVEAQKDKDHGCEESLQVDGELTDVTKATEEELKA